MKNKYIMCFLICICVVILSACQNKPDELYINEQNTQSPTQSVNPTVISTPVPTKSPQISPMPQTPQVQETVKLLSSEDETQISLWNEGRTGISRYGLNLVIEVELIEEYGEDTSKAEISSYLSEDKILEFKNMGSFYMAIVDYDKTDEYVDVIVYDCGTDMSFIAKIYRYSSNRKLEKYAEIDNGYFTKIIYDENGNLYYTACFDGEYDPDGPEWTMAHFNYRTKEISKVTEPDLLNRLNEYF